MKVTTHSAKETKKLATKFASQLKGGEIIGFIGDLGSGKTTFVQGIAEYFKINEIVNSPTFNILKTYSINSELNLCHIDLYRLHSYKEMEDLGVEDFLGQKGWITLIEWADKFIDDLPKETKYLTFTYLTETDRQIEGEL